MAEGVLRFKDVEKTFGATRALKGVSFDVRRGEVLALLGENGAGKSTLIKILGGIVRADAGQVEIDGETYRHQVKSSGAGRRVSFIHQDLGLIEWMTVAENIGLAQGFSAPRRARRSFGIDWAGARQDAREALAQVGCDLDPDTRVLSLSRTEKSLVAIARALIVDCDYLVLDEPTASLPADEVARLFAAVGRLTPARRRHDLRVAPPRRDLPHRRPRRGDAGRPQGRREDRPAETSPAELVSLIVGRSDLELFRKAELRPGPVRARVDQPG